MHIHEGTALAPQTCLVWQSLSEEVNDISKSPGLRGLALSTEPACPLFSRHLR